MIQIDKELESGSKMQMTPPSQSDWQRLLVDPDSGRELYRDHETLVTEDGRTISRRRGDVWSFMEVPDDFYEGAYLNRTRFIPKTDNWLGRLPFFLATNGYVWEICRNVAPGSTVLELGCAGGVDFLAQRYDMIGLDVSYQSLSSMGNYVLKLQASAAEIPLKAQSVDGVISSYFWEHMPAETKDAILVDLARILRPLGRIVFLYDIETDNGLIRRARDIDPERYRRTFIDHDGHLGYETADANAERFERHGFRVVKQIGMERTWIQSASAYSKLKEFPGSVRHVGRIGAALSAGRLGYLGSLAVVRGVDASIGRLWPVKNSRIMMTVAELAAK